MKPDIPENFCDQLRMVNHGVRNRLHNSVNETLHIKRYGVDYVFYVFEVNSDEIFVFLLVNAISIIS